MSQSAAVGALRDPLKKKLSVGWDAKMSKNYCISIYINIIYLLFIFIYLFICSFIYLFIYIYMRYVCLLFFVHVHICLMKTYKRLVFMTWYALHRVYVFESSNILQHVYACNVGLVMSFLSIKCRTSWKRSPSSSWTPWKRASSRGPAASFKSLPDFELSRSRNYHLSRENRWDVGAI